MRSRGVFWVLSGAMNDVLSIWFAEHRAAEDPRTIRQGMNAFDVARFGGDPERLRRNAEQTCGLVQIEPRLDPVRRQAEDRNRVVRPERGDPLPRPAIAVAGQQTVSVEDAGNQTIIGDEDQLPDSGEDVGRGAVALPAATLRQAQFGMDAANPMDLENDLGRFIIDIGDHLVEDGARCAS